MNTIFYRQWRLVALTVGMIVVMGLSALATVPRQEDPTITNLFATILTPYPGADPERVEALVTEKIEEELRTIPEIDEITSVSRSGISVVQVELSSFIGDAEIEQAWSEIRDALSDAARNLPPGVPEPEVDTDRTGAYTAISSLTFTPEGPMDGGRSWAILQRHAEMLQDRLRNMPGTELVRLFGQRPEQILVTLDPSRLASAGLTAADVAGAIRTADAKVEAGLLTGPSRSLLLEVTGEIRSIDRVRHVPLAAGRDGRLLRVADVAEVSRTAADPPPSMALDRGQPAILVAARMQTGRQVDSWMAAIRAELAAFEADLPIGLTHDLVFDQSTYTVERLHNLAGNLAIGVGIVIAVLFVTLGWRAATVVATVLPLTACSSLAILQAIGVPVHQMSVTGMIVALGLLVDAAIVMADQIRRRLADGESRLQAVGESVDRLAVPLLASTVTTVLAFLPMVMLPGPAGDFVGSIALAVIVMLVTSFALAVTITPALAGWLLADPQPGADTGRATLAGRLFEASLGLALANPRLGVMAALVLPVLGFVAFPTLTAQFFPAVDRDQFHIQVHLPAAASIHETARVARSADQLLAGRDEIRQVQWVIGESAPAFYYNMQMTQDGAAGFAEALITTDSADATDRLIPEIQAALDQALPQAQSLVRGLKQGPPVAAPVEIRLVGPDLATLRRLGEQVRARMAEVAVITHTRANLVGGAPKVVVDLDEDRTRLAGLTLTGVAGQLDAALDGAIGGSLLERTEELPVRVRVGDRTRADLAAIRGLNVLPPSDSAARLAAEGAWPGVPLTAIGAARVEPASSPIARRNGERINTVQGYIRLGVLPEEALRLVQARLDATPIDLPAGYRVEVGGDADARNETIANLISTLGLVVVLTVATIVLTFNNFMLSIITGLVAVLSMGLSLLALAVFGYPFGIQAVIGVIGSIGVSVNAAIIILTSLQQDAGSAAGDIRAMRRVVAGSARHIVSTTVTTFGGFLPLILAGGGFWPPFAMAIAGGVLLSTVVSFYFTPPMFRLLTTPTPRPVTAPPSDGHEGAVAPSTPAWSTAGP